MVGIGGVGYFCIDVREATVSDYRAFLASNARPPRPPECAFKASNEPATWPYPHAEDALPMTKVDWCDAWAYCAWAGKRLCGGRKGAALDFVTVTSPEDEHYRACTNERTSKFPYGQTFIATGCNVAGYQQPNKLLPPGAAITCHGADRPFSLITDLVGNASEWSRSCEPNVGNDAGEDNCRLRGGGWYSVTEDGCTDADFYPRGSASPSTGIRCCADPQ